MATWTQPAAWYREPDTDVNLSGPSTSFAARFKAHGRCEILPDHTARFVCADTGTAYALPASGDVPSIVKVGDSSATEYTNHRVSSVTARSYDNATSLIEVQIVPLTVNYVSPEQVDEVEWETHTTPIQAAPRYRSTLISTSCSYDGKTILAGHLFKEWTMAQTTDEALAMYAAMDSRTKELADRWAAGLRDYEYSTPVVRRATRGEGYIADGAGQFENPTASYPSGYTYKRTAARSVRQGEGGTWENSKEWRGYHHIYTDLETE